MSWISRCPVNYFLPSSVLFRSRRIRHSLQIKCCRNVAECHNALQKERQPLFTCHTASLLLYLPQASLCITVSEKEGKMDPSEEKFQIHFSTKSVQYILSVVLIYKFYSAVKCLNHTQIWLYVLVNVPYFPFLPASPKR